MIIRINLFTLDLELFEANSCDCRYPCNESRGITDIKVFLSSLQTQSYILLLSYAEEYIFHSLSPHLRTRSLLSSRKYACSTQMVIWLNGWLVIRWCVLQSFNLTCRMESGTASQRQYTKKATVDKRQRTKPYTALSGVGEGLCSGSSGLANVDVILDGDQTQGLNKCDNSHFVSAETVQISSHLLF